MSARSRLAEYPILFGHRSVGADLLQGVSRLAPALPVHELAAPEDSPRPGINHFRAGENHAPARKFRDLADRAQQARHCVLAGIKLCYVDIRADTDIDGLFRLYRETLDRLLDSAPALRLFHVTVPLRSARPGLRARLRMLVGRPIRVLEDNLRREAYNDMLRDTWGDDGSLFDLAALESRNPEGESCRVAYRGLKVPVLAPDLTRDGGHLNPDGAMRLADAWLDFLGTRLTDTP
ncbi:MAG TPA: hypothetical protein ENJ79_05070 [Gammaproteobacteria bacterium]|nr:hypothetical protein [Gammaproteobacteria bacterium]